MTDPTICPHGHIPPTCEMCAAERDEDYMRPLREHVLKLQRARDDELTKPLHVEIEALRKRLSTAEAERDNLNVVVSSYIEEQGRLARRAELAESKWARLKTWLIRLDQWGYRGVAEHMTALDHEGEPPCHN